MQAGDLVKGVTSPLVAKMKSKNNGRGSTEMQKERETMRKRGEEHECFDKNIKVENKLLMLLYLCLKSI